MLIDKKRGVHKCLAQDLFQHDLHVASEEIMLRKIANLHETISIAKRACSILFTGNFVSMFLKLTLSVKQPGSVQYVNICMRSA